MSTSACRCPADAALESLGLEILLIAALIFVIIAVATGTRAAGEMVAVQSGGD